MSSYTIVFIALVPFRCHLRGIYLLSFKDDHRYWPIVTLCRKPLDSYYLTPFFYTHRVPRLSQLLDNFAYLMLNPSLNLCRILL